MKVVSIASSKGGVGKSTLSRAVASGLHSAGLRVGLLDVDVAQQTSYHWFQLAKENDLADTTPTVLSADGSKITMMVKALSDDFDVLVIDTIGTTSGREAIEIVGQAIRVADLLLIPLNPSSEDELDATLKLDSVIRKTMIDFPEKEIRYVLSRMNPRQTTWELDSVKSFLDNREARGMKVLGAPMFLRESYLKTHAHGITPLAMRKSDAARKDIEAVIAEVMEILDLSSVEAAHG